MKFDPTSRPTAPTPEQLAELGDVLATAAELERLYAALTRHPRILTTPGSNDVFLACQDQVVQDKTVIGQQLGDLFPLVQNAAPEPGGEADRTKTGSLPPRLVSLPDVEPADPGKSVFETVQRAFHLEDFLLQQLNFSLASARERRDLKLELQLRMIILSAQQRCGLLNERYGFARSKSVLVQGLRKQTTRLLARLHGEERHDID